MNGIGQLQSGQGIAAIESRVRQIEAMLSQFRGQAVSPAPDLQTSLNNASVQGKFLNALSDVKNQASALSTLSVDQGASENVPPIQGEFAPGAFEPQLDPGVPQLPPLESVSSLQSLESHSNSLAALQAMSGVLKVPADNTASPNGDKKSIATLVDSLSQKHGVDNALVNALIQQESSFNPQAVSRSGAVGLMQLMPQTAKALGVSNPANPGENLDGGIRYLKQLLGQFNGNIPLALAAYNAGPSAVKKYGGIPPYGETQRYVKNILKTYLASRQGETA